MRYLYSILFVITIIFVILIGLVLFFYPGLESENDENINVTENPLLWRIEGENPSYLYGSIHLADEGIVTLPDVVVDALDSSDVIYTEIKLDAETLAKSAQQSILSDNVSLYDLIPDHVENKLKSYIEDNEFTNYAEILGFSSYKVWFAASSLAILENFKSLIFYLPLDYYIWNLAIQKGKDARGLETVELQIDIFDTLDLNEQIKLLNETLDILIQYSNEDMSITELFISSYIRGDLHELQNLSFIGADLDDPLFVNIRNKVVIDRNINMSEDISNLIQTNPDISYFFTIGAGHFHGESGLINLLKENGFTLNRVEFDKSDECDIGERRINQRCYKPYVVR